jgi:glyoxylase-like metal-dependent hydrolase (beta-lactamase superfamily II)
MIATHILPHLHQLVIPTPFPVGPVNVYLCTETDEPLALIDTGPRTGETWEALEKDLALSKVLARLEWLEVRGQATSQTENGVV